MPQVALQAGQSHGDVSGVEGLRADKERADHPHEDHTVLPVPDETGHVPGQEDREDKGRGEEQETGPVYVGEQLSGAVEAASRQRAHDGREGFPSDA